MTTHGDYTKLISGPKSDDSEFPDSAVKPLVDSEVGGGDHDHADTPSKRTVTVKHAEITTKTDWKFAARVGLYIFLWYFFNVIYNIFNKRVLNVIFLGWTVSIFQLVVGSFYVSVIWLSKLRVAPSLSFEDLKVLAPIAFFHMLMHTSSVIALGAGSVSFFQIVKAAEPVFTSVLTSLILRQNFKFSVYLALTPIILGVTLTSFTEANFSWLSFAGAMISNLAAALRAILSKATMQKPVGKNMTPANLFGVLTVLACLMGVPIALAVEFYKVPSTYEKAFKSANSTASESQAWFDLLLSGIAFYWYNEVAFLALSEIHPITHAVANTFKRVVIILATVAVFGNPVTPLGALGCTIAVLGTFIYSLVKGGKGH
eukprot:c17553_g1_i1.p1 GENE.c17553_g1_i1~~c17553_g1_i1.p1  ORF type:complete len:400 (+),score=105.57 c17553_g1_i1:86-1201(+)